MPSAHESARESWKRGARRYSGLTIGERRHLQRRKLDEVSGASIPNRLMAGLMTYLWYHWH